MFQFGSTGNTGTNTSTFGAQNTTLGNKPATTTMGGGLFGNTTNTTSTTGGGLFGNKNMFGTGSNSSTTGSGGLFGGNSLQGTTTSSGGLFGNKTLGSASTGGTGLFGSSSSTTAPTTTTNTNTNTGTGLFGSKPATTATGTGLFGSKPATTTTGTGTSFGLFGQQAQQQQQQQQPQQNALGGLKYSTPTFSWSQQPSNTQPRAQGFPQSQLPQQQQFGLGLGQNQSAPLLNSMNSQQSLLFPSQQQQQSLNYPQQIQNQLLKCRESWDAANPRSKLRSYVYNKVDQGEIILSNYKPNNVPQEEWDRAVEARPSSDVVPIELLGFEALNQRNQLQIENVAQVRIILKELLEKNKSLQQRHELEIASRVQRVEGRNIELERRILRLGAQLAILKNRGLPLSIKEEKLLNNFSKLLKRSTDPAGLGKTNEIWARLSILKDRANKISERLDNALLVIDERKNGGGVIDSVATGANDGYTGGSAKNTTASTTTHPRILHEEDTVVDVKLDKAVKILSTQQRGISYLEDVLKKDHEIVDKLRKR